MEFVLAIVSLRRIEHANLMQSSHPKLTCQNRHITVDDSQTEQEALL